jgi:hypothetical protein
MAECETIRSQPKSEVPGLVQDYIELKDAIAVTVWKDTKSGKWTITATFAKS